MDKDAMKILIALALNLRNSARNRREKEKLQRRWGYSEPYSTMAFQARAMYHSLFNAFFLAKKSVGRE